jgi:hypothetical protein
MMSLEEYLTPDPSLREPAPEPLFIPDTLPSRASRQIALHSKGSVRGFDFIDGRKTWYEAELEWKCGLVAKINPDVVDVAEQPPAVAYIDDDGIRRHHTFDWRVVKADNSKTLVAVKPAALVAKSGIERTLELIRCQIGKRTADYVLLFTEEKLTPIDLCNAETIHHALRDPSPADDAAVGRLVTKLRRPVRIADLVERAKRGGYGFDAVVRAIADGRLRLVEHRKIDYDAVVARVKKH